MTLSRNPMRHGKRTTTALGFLAVGMALSLTLASGALAVSPVGLLTADSYAVTAEATITNTGTTFLNGDLALWAGAAVVGAPTVSGTSRIGVAPGNAAGRQALLDVNNAYIDARDRTGATVIAGSTLGGLTLTPGVYKDSGAPASLGLTGTLTLNGGGDATAVFIFQSASTLITEVNSRVIPVGVGRRRFAPTHPLPVPAPERG